MNGDLFNELAAQFHAGSDETPSVPPHPLDDPASRPAAVLIPVTAKPEPGVILTHRPSSMRAHPGQIAFPGGKIDPGEDAIAAALREAWEELAIPPDAVRVVGAEAPFHSGSGYFITPVLGVIPPDLAFVPNPSEVADWFEAPLAFMLDDANHLLRTGIFGGVERQYYEITWQQHRVWGLTANIIRDLARRLRRAP